MRNHSLFILSKTGVNDMNIKFEALNQNKNIDKLVTYGQSVATHNTMQTPNAYMVEFGMQNVDNNAYGNAHCAEEVKDFFAEMDLKEEQYELGQGVISVQRPIYDDLELVKGKKETKKDWGFVKWVLIGFVGVAIAVVVSVRKIQLKKKILEEF